MAEGTRIPEERADSEEGIGNYTPEEITEFEQEFGAYTYEGVKYVLLHKAHSNCGLPLPEAGKVKYCALAVSEDGASDVMLEFVFDSPEGGSVSVADENGFPWGDGPTSVYAM
ncbi:MAG: hypothetical protein HQL50_14615 [Magnetococcales bacterium]|nr:hypothetical protein [Magnetococcales bacterium]